MWIGHVGLGSAPINIVALAPTASTKSPLQKPPSTITVGGKVVDMEAGPKAPKVRSRRDKSLGRLVIQIAAERGLETQVSPDLAGKVLIYANQQSQSNLAALDLCGLQR